MTDPSLELVFAGAVEGLFIQGLGRRVTPALLEELKGVGLDLSRELLPTYPRRVWNTALPIAVKHVWPELDVAAGHYQLGRTIIDGFKQTRLGQVLERFATMLGPMRTLSRMRQNLRTGANYNEVTVTQQAPNDALFWINEPTIHPGYVQGLLHGSIEVAGCFDGTVEIVAQDELGTTYRVRWGKR